MTSQQMVQERDELIQITRHWPEWKQEFCKSLYHSNEDINEINKQDSFNSRTGEDEKS